MSSSESEILEWSRTIPVFPYWETPAHHALQTSSSCWICCSNSSARVASILDTEAPWGCKNNLTSIAQRMMKHVIFVIIKYFRTLSLIPEKTPETATWNDHPHRPKSVPEAEPPCMVCCTVLGTLPLRFEVRAVAWHRSCCEIWRKIFKYLQPKKTTSAKASCGCGWNSFPVHGLCQCLL